MQPAVRAFANPALAAWMQQLHPLRLQYELFANTNPAMAQIEGLAQQVRQQRVTVAKDNPFLAAQEQFSNQAVKALDMWRQWSETVAEKMFLNVFGTPALQAALGIDSTRAQPQCKAARNPLHRQLAEKRTDELRARIPVGGPREAVIRALLYAGMPRGAIDERGFEMARRLRESHGDLSLAAFKELIREQFSILLLDEKAALAAIPTMLPPDAETRNMALNLIRKVLSARGALSAEDEERMRTIAQLFAPDEPGGTKRPRSRPEGEKLARAS
jgi:hypothetical protein